MSNWLRQAIYDLDTAKDNFNIKRYSYAIFLSEQSVEKALKSLFLKEFGEIPRVHDLTVLAKKLKVPDKLYGHCEDLTNVYMETRYPDVSEVIPAEKFTRDEANSFISKAEEVLEWIKKKF